MRSVGEGGWNAACVDMGGLVAEHMQHSLNINYRTEQLRKRCVQSMHSLRSRKGAPPGEVPAEIWRLIFEPQWVRPGFRGPWGVGLSGLF